MTSFYVIVHYAAGRAGIGWAQGQPRTVRIPFVTREAAERTAEAARSGAGGCYSSLPVGVIPDSVRLEEPPPTTWRRSR